MQVCMYNMWLKERSGEQKMWFGSVCFIIISFIWFNLFEENLYSSHEVKRNSARLLERKVK